MARSGADPAPARAVSSFTLPCPFALPPRPGPLAAPLPGQLSPSPSLGLSARPTVSHSCRSSTAPVRLLILLPHARPPPLPEPLVRHSAARAARPLLAPLVRRLRRWVGARAARAAHLPLAPLIRHSCRSSAARAARSAHPRLAQLVSSLRRSSAACSTCAACSARLLLSPLVRSSLLGLSFVPLSGSATPFLAQRVREFDSVGTWFLAASLEKQQKVLWTNDG